MKDYGTKYPKDELRWLARALKQWTRLVGDYASHHAEDVPYYYNETANVGMFASAACMSGMFALTDHRADKLGVDKNSYSGRSDLYVCQRTGNEYAAVEAKQLWLTEGMEWPTKIGAMLSKAIVDARNGDQGCPTRVGAVFITYKAPAEFASKDLRKSCDRLVKAASLRFDALAWAFPRCERPLHAKDRNGMNWSWPGVVLGLKVARAPRCRS